MFRFGQKITILLVLGLLSTSALGLSTFEKKLEEDVWVGPSYSLVDTINKIGDRLRDNPYSAFDHYILSQAYIRLFNEEPSNLLLIQKANDLAQQSIELAPSDDYGTVALANMLSFMGQPTRGIKYIGEILHAGISKDSWRVYFMLGQLNSDINGPDTQLVFFKKALAQKDAPREIIVPFIIERLKNNFQGEELTRQLLSWNDRYPNYHFSQEIAVSYAQTNKYEASDAMFLKINKSVNRSVASLTNHAILLYQNLARPADSLKNLQEAEKMAASNDEYSKTIVKLHLAATHLRLNQDAKASAIYVDLLVKNDLQSDLMALIRTSYEDSKKLKSYLTLLSDVSREMGSSVLYETIGRSADELNENTLAVSAFKNSIILNPNSSELYNLLGLSLYKTKNLEDALAQFENASRLSPNSPSAQYNRACMLALLRRVDESLAALEMAIKLDPNLRDAAVADKDFANIREHNHYQKITRPITAVAH